MYVKMITDCKMSLLNILRRPVIQMISPMNKLSAANRDHYSSWRGKILETHFHPCLTKIQLCQEIPFCTAV